MAWIDRLSFPVQVWTHFGSQEVERLKNHTMSDTKVIVLVPASTEHQRTVILEHLRRHVIYLSLVRLLFVLETADDLSYKEYPESAITSVANVPSVERAIETTEDVDGHARAGLILPCVIEHRYTHRKVTESRRGTLGTLNRLLEGCGPSCLAGRDGDACIRASRRGTHVFLDMSEADGRCRNNMSGISPGNDHFDNLFFGFFVSKAFPYIQEHRNLLSALFQSVIIVEIFVPKGSNITTEDPSNTSREGTDAHENQVWTHFGSLEVERLKNHTMSDTKVIVLVPASTEHQRTVILEHLRRHIIYLSLVRLLFVLETADGLSYKEYPESEITSVANVPSVERAIETIEDVDRHARAGLILPCVIEHKYTHRKVTESVTGTLGTLNRLLDDCGPSCLAGRDGDACHFGNFFIGFFVSKAFPYIQEYCNLLSALFQSGLYDATRGELDRKNRSPFVNEEEVWTHFGRQEVERLKNHTVSDTKVIVPVPAFIEHERTVILEHLKRHVICLFLVRPLFVLETADGLSYKEYPESAITSVASVPSVERAIETTEDVDGHARAGLILPCVIEHRYTHRKVTESRRGTLGTLNRLLKDCGPSCLAGRDGDACIRASRRGTHVFLNMSQADGRCRNDMSGISPGNDNFDNLFFGFFVSKAFPYIQEHRNLLSALFQSGLYDATCGEVDRQNRSPFVNEEEVWTHFGSHEVERLKNHTMSDTKVIVLVPASMENQRTVILEHLRRHVIYLSLVRLLFVLETADVSLTRNIPKIPATKRYVTNARTINWRRMTTFAAACEQYLRSVKKKKKRKAVRELLKSRKTLGEYATIVRQMYEDPDGRDFFECFRMSRAR
ncbi:hypothetical protein HPB47_020127 [Ixodes persulcatus]|uniref:Uncharacterized protein n=1 Tax=Ixodes persulcatus TaxID=34615 RepID=A0AC60QH98_IXOPE|nr:hypothetical protein HPB47_020127 [Ixodes persulcatus]